VRWEHHGDHDAAHQPAAKIPRQHTPRTAIMVGMNFSRWAGSRRCQITIFRGDVVPPVEFLQHAVEIMQLRLARPSDSAVCKPFQGPSWQNRFLSEPLWRNIGSSSREIDCTNEGTRIDSIHGLKRYPSVPTGGASRAGLLPLFVHTS
jgi:hypothetical protein